MLLRQNMSKSIQITDYIKDENNFNTHTPEGMELLKKSVKTVGIIEAITVSADNKITNKTKCCAYCNADVSDKGFLNRTKERYFVNGLCVACYSRLRKTGKIERKILIPNKYPKRLRNIYYKMIKRCYNVKNDDYGRYGGRGIKVFDEWIKSPIRFYEWALKNGYNDDLSIDRINNNGNYEPSNCRWVNYKTQNNNRRDNVFIVYNNKRQTIPQWADETNIDKYVLFARLNKLKWSIEKALTTPVRALRYSLKTP